jgi:hypothetical protein
VEALTGREAEIVTVAGSALKIGFLFVVSRICLLVMSSICALAGFARLTFVIITSHDVIPLRLRHHFRPADCLYPVWCRCASI